MRPKTAQEMTDAELDAACAELDKTANNMRRAWPVLEQHGMSASADTVSDMAEKVDNRYNQLDEERDRRRRMARN